MKGIFFVCFSIGASLLMSSCGGRQTSSHHTQYDSLFLGIYLGMERKAFYDHCWELNRLKVFTNGPTTASVEYKLDKELDQPVMMRFYPDFYKEKIVDMPVTFSYEAWAPWNKQYTSEVLFPKVLLIFEKWYGKEFKMMEHPTMGTLFYKMDGKRRINLFIRDDQFVQAVFTDLELDREREKELSKNSVK